MLLDAIFTFSIWLLDFFIDLIPQFPPPPENIIVSINSILDLIFSYSGLINFFLPVPLILTLLAVVVVVEVLKHSWAIIDFGLRHIPIIGTH